MYKTTLRKYLEQKRLDIYAEIDEVRDNFMNGEISVEEFQELNSKLNSKLDIVLDVIQICAERKHY